MVTVLKTVDPKRVREFESHLFHSNLSKEGWSIFLQPLLPVSARVLGARGWSPGKWQRLREALKVCKL